MPDRLITITVCGMAPLACVQAGAGDTGNGNGTQGAPAALTEPADDGPGRADLAVIGVSLGSDRARRAHGGILVSYGVRNAGDASSGDYVISVYASVNSVIAETDTRLWRFSQSSLPPGDTRPGAVFLHIPHDMATGPYYIGAIVSPGANEINLDNNVGRAPGPLLLTDCPADVNADGYCDPSDIGVFVSGFGAVYPLADLNGDGIYDLRDIALFVESFNAGCP